MIITSLINAFPKHFISVSTRVCFPNGYYDDKTNALNLEVMFYDNSVNVCNEKLILNGKNGFISIIHYYMKY